MALVKPIVSHPHSRWFIVSYALHTQRTEVVNQIINAVVSILTIPVAVRRCHDINKSGWAYITPMLIILGMIVLALILGGSAVLSLITTGGLSAGFSLAGLGAAAAVVILIFPVAIGVVIYYVVNFVKESYPEKNKWGEVPTSTKKAETKQEKNTEDK